MPKKIVRKEGLGERIRQLRLARDWSQEEFGQKINIHLQTIRVYEKDKTVPSALVLKKMAEVFGVTSDYLLFGESEGGSAKIKNKELLKRVQQLDQVNPESIKDLLGIMDVIIRQHQIKDLAKAS